MNRSPLSDRVMPLRQGVWLSEDEHNDLYTKAVKKVMSKYYEQYVADQVESGAPSDPITSELISAIMSKKKACTSSHCFVTINPVSLISFSEFQRAVEKAMSKKWITDYLYAYEQRSDSLDSVHGYHVHILFKRNDKAPSQIRNEFNNTFKHIVGHTRSIDIQFDSSKMYKNRISYILGNKKDKEKLVKTNVDVLWRQSIGLQPYYVKGLEMEECLKSYL